MRFFWTQGRVIKLLLHEFGDVIVDVFPNVPELVVFLGDHDVDVLLCLEDLGELLNHLLALVVEPRDETGCELYHDVDQILADTSGGI